MIRIVIQVCIAQKIRSIVTDTVETDKFLFGVDAVRIVSNIQKTNDSLLITDRLNCVNILLCEPAALRGVNRGLSVRKSDPVTRKPFWCSISSRNASEGTE